MQDLAHLKSAAFIRLVAVVCPNVKPDKVDAFFSLNTLKIHMNMKKLIANLYLEKVKHKATLCIYRFWCPWICAIAPTQLFLGGDTNEVDSLQEIVQALIGDNSKVGDSTHPLNFQAKAQNAIGTWQ